MHFSILLIVVQLLGANALPLCTEYGCPNYSALILESPNGVPWIPGPSQVDATSITETVIVIPTPLAGIIAQETQRSTSTSTTTFSQGSTTTISLELATPDPASTGEITSQATQPPIVTQGDSILTSKTTSPEGTTSQATRTPRVTRSISILTVSLSYMPKLLQ